MAQDLGLPILPLSIRGTRHVLPARTFQLRPGTAELEIHPPIAIDGVTEEELPALIERVREAVATGLGA